MAWKAAAELYWTKVLRRAHVPEPEASARFLTQAASSAWEVKSMDLGRIDDEENET